MNLPQIGMVYRKEMLDTLRDRRTLVSMIVVPLLVIPGFMFGLTELAVKAVQQAAGDRATSCGTMTRRPPYQRAPQSSHTEKSKAMEWNRVQTSVVASSKLASI